MASKMEVLFQYVTFNFPAIAMNFSNEWLSCIPLFIGLNGWKGEKRGRERQYVDIVFIRFAIGII